MRLQTSNLAAQTDTVARTIHPYSVPIKVEARACDITGETNGT